MATATASVDRRAGGQARVDPRAPRFGQALTTIGLVLAIFLSSPELVYLVSAVLLTALLSRWRVDPYAILWRRLVQPAVGRPETPEPAAPHRFAKLLGAGGTTAASILLLVGIPMAGYVLAALVAAAAGLAALTGLCIGCRLYRQVGFFRRHAIV